MSIRHVTDFNGKARVRINRDDRSPPWGSNLVQGDVRQETPNGVAIGADGCHFGYPGSRSGMPQAGPICGGETLIGKRTGE